MLAAAAGRSLLTRTAVWNASPVHPHPQPITASAPSTPVTLPVVAARSAAPPAPATRRPPTIVQVLRHTDVIAVQDIEKIGFRVPAVTASETPQD